MGTEYSVLSTRYESPESCDRPRIDVDSRLLTPAPDPPPPMASGKAQLAAPERGNESCTPRRRSRTQSRSHGRTTECRCRRNCGAGVRFRGECFRDWACLTQFLSLVIGHSSFVFREISGADE